MLDRVLAFTIPAFLVGGAGLWVASRSAAPAVRRERLVKWVTYVVIVHAVVLAAWAGVVAMTALVVAIALASAAELSAVKRVGPVAWIGLAAAVAGSIALPLVAGAAMTLWVYLVVAAFDGFSQVAGQLAGRHAIAPRISPSKTIEGTAGGIVAGLVVAYLLRSIAGLSVSTSVGIGSAVCAAAFGGDLSESGVKRRAGIKDFGTLLPGHGGALDRFDSFLAAAGLLGWGQVLLRNP